MSISVQQDIGPLIDQRLPAFVQRFPDHAVAITELVHDFHDRFDDRVLGNLEEGTFCEFIEQWIESKDLDPTLKEAIHRERLQIFFALMRTLSLEFTLPTNADLSRPRDPSERRTGNAPAQRRTREQISEVVMQYAQLAVYLGDNVALDILEMAGILLPGERGSALSAISDYLGDCAPPDRNGIIVTILRSNDVILQNMTVYEKMHRSLVEYCYQELIAENGDTLENQPLFIADVETWICSRLDSLYERAFGKQSKKISRTHRDLYEGVVLHFKAAAALKIPKTMAQTATDHNGVEWPLGSWRQRLALTEMLDPRKRHVYVGFGAGEGKTFTHFWGYELAKEERRRKHLEGRTRMLFFAPKAVISEIPNRIRPGTVSKTTESRYYPNEEDAPSVGVIQKGMTVEQIREAASKDVVFCAYSMWHRTRRETNGDGEAHELSIKDLLIEQHEPFTNLSFDEAHILQGDKILTDHARETIRRIPGLHRDGHIMFGSATPAPGHLNGLRVSLELLERPRQNITPGERREAPPNQWAELRRMMGKLWMMDKPEDWMRFVEHRPYDLTPQEHACVDLVVDDNTMPALQKLYLSQLIIRCPRLMSSNPNVPWTSFEETTRHLSTLLFADDRSTVLVAENMLSNRVLQKAREPEEDELHNPEEYFYGALSTWCANQNITFHVIHGDTPEDDRIAIYEDMQNAKNTKRKCVLYAQSACLNLGIDLRFLEGIISQQWPYNTPDLYQLLKRALRMGNTDCRVIVSTANNTVEDGILMTAQSKYADVLRCFYGTMALSDQRMSELQRRGIDHNNEGVARTIESAEQKSRRISHTLHSKGSARTQGFWQRNFNDFFKLLEQKNSTSAGDADRAIASLVLDMEESGMIPENGRYIHSCSGGQRLTQALHSVSPEKHRLIRSMDATQDMLDYGGLTPPLPNWIDQTQNIPATPDSFSPLVQQGVIQTGSQDLVVLQGLDQTSHTNQNGELQYTGRVRALRGAALALKNPGAVDATTGIEGNGGILVIPLEFDSCSDLEMRQLREQLIAFGLEVIDSHTGILVSKDNHGEPPFQMYIVTARKVFDTDHSDIASIDPAMLNLSLLPNKEVKSRKRRKLPFGLPHEEFRIGRKQLKHHVPTVGKEEKLQYLGRLTKAIGDIRALASSSEEMMAKVKKKAMRQTLEDMGIVCFPHFSSDAKKKKGKEGESERRLAFCFIGSPHLFYPFDPQWAKTEEEPE